MYPNQYIYKNEVFDTLPLIPNFLYGLTFHNCIFNKPFKAMNCVFFGCSFLERADSLQRCLIYDSLESFMDEFFVKVGEHWVGLKGFDWHYNPAKHWKLKKGELLTDTVDEDCSYACAKGINIGTYNWLCYSPDSLLNDNHHFSMWAVMIPSDAKIIVPITQYHSKKIRVDKIYLLAEKDFKRKDVQKLCQLPKTIQALEEYFPDVNLLEEIARYN